MNLSKRVKIFSPFDALKGFNEELMKVKLYAESDIEYNDDVKDDYL